MLGRTASSLFWMSRYMERAENLARLIEVGYRISLTPGVGGHRNEWRSTLVSAASLDGYVAKYGDQQEVDCCSIRITRRRYAPVSRRHATTGAACVPR